MAKNRVKIIELPTHQVLVEKKLDTEGEETVEAFAVHLFMEDDKDVSVKVTATLGFESAEKRDKAFDEYNEEHAAQFLSDIMQMVAPDDKDELQELDALEELDKKEGGNDDANN